MASGSSLLLWFVLSTLVVFSRSRTLCPRIFFQNIDETKMPYKMIEGVFVKEKNDHNNFPVYRRENDNLLFYYFVGNEGGKFLIFGIGLQHYFGVAATVFSFVEPSVWLSSGTLDRNDVFGGLAHQWQYFNTRDDTNYLVNSSPMIKAVCVEEDFRECNSDRVYLNMNFTDGNGNVLNHLTQDYFSRKSSSFRHLRPVYVHSRQQLYLQYVDSYWVVTSSYLPGSSNDGVYMRVRDLALRPEYISNTWSVHYNGWRVEPDLRVMCRGVSSMSNTCQSKPCDNKATCVYTSGNETLCLCSTGYTGLTCSINKQCPTPKLITGKELNITYPGNRPGDLGMSFCSGSYPSVRFFLCLDGINSPIWKRQGLPCRGPDVTRAPPVETRTPWYSRTFSTPTAKLITRTPWYSRTFSTPTAKPINFDDNPGIHAAVLTVAILLQVLLPFVLWSCAFCRKKCEEKKEEKDDERGGQEVGEELKNRLEMVDKAESQEERDQGVREYRRTVEEYRKETEEKEVSRRRGFFRNVTLWRLISMDLYVSFFLWLTYLVGCDVTECTRYGRIFLHLRIIAIAMLAFSTLMVLCESAFSHELDYLKNTMQDETAWGYIQRMHEVPPRIHMVVECYHFETRTRVVYYTDSNGNSQSRTETYQELVVTFTDTDEFSFGSWVDVSKKTMPELSMAAVTRVKIEPHIMFGDEETAANYDRQVAEMIERNRHRDVFTAYSSSREIAGLVERICAYTDLKVKPFWIRPLFFWMATLLFMTWPYRWLFRAKTAKTYYALKKKMYKSTTPPREADLMDPITALVGNASCIPSTNGPQNMQPGIGNPAFQNSSAPYPPLAYAVRPQPSAPPPS